MRIPRLNLRQYQKSLNKTQKVKRTISQNKIYNKKVCKQEAEKEQELIAYLKKQKELETEIQEKLNNAIIDIQANELQVYALLLYGKLINKEKIVETLKARKAK